MEENRGEEGSGTGLNQTLYPSFSPLCLLSSFLHLFICPDLLLLMHRHVLVVGRRGFKHQIFRMFQEVTGCSRR